MRILQTAVRSFTVLLLFILLGSAVSAFDGRILIKDPARFSDWTIMGPAGGDVRSIEVDPRDKDKLYISTMDGQVLMSEDAGKNWQMLVKFDRPMLFLDQLFVDSRDSNIIYASGHRGKQAGGFFKSVDAGKTWKESKELRDEAIHSMTQAAKEPDTLFVGTINGIFVSHDSGDSWKKMESTTLPLAVNSMAVDPRDTSTIYAGTTWRPYKSTDSGKSWRLIKAGMIDDSDIFAITINSKNNDHLIASACSGIYQSFNGGERWTKIQGIPSQSRRTRDIVQHPSIPDTIFAGTTEGFWVSRNGGKTWAMTTSRNTEVNSIAVHPDAPERVFIATNNFGVLVSNDGGRSFAPTNNNFSSRLIYSIIPDATQTDRLYAITHNTSTTGGFFFSSNDGGANWQQAKGLDINRVSPYAILQSRNDSNKILLGTSSGIYISTDRAASWKVLTGPKPVKAPVRRTARGKRVPAPKAPKAPEGPTLIPTLSHQVKLLAHTDDDKNGVFAGTNKGLYRSYDITKGWEKLSFGEGIDEDVFAVHSSPLVPGTIWVGTARSGVIVSTDNGATWTKAEGVPASVPISSIASDPTRPNFIYVGTIHTLYLSRDGGRTWTRRGGNLPLGNYTSILIDPNDPDKVFVSSALENDGGVFYSENAGMNWKRVDSKEMKVPSRRVWMMAFDPTDPSRIYAGSHSSGVYRINRMQTAVAGTTQASESGN